MDSTPSPQAAATTVSTPALVTTPSTAHPAPTPTARPSATPPPLGAAWTQVVLGVGEIFDFASLAKDCAEDGRYEFMFVAPALPITGAVGSPVNPLAIK